jgi:hypothetical protein
MQASAPEGTVTYITDPATLQACADSLRLRLLLEPGVQLLPVGTEKVAVTMQAKTNKKPKAAASAGGAVCARAKCRKPLLPPTLQCARCKAVAYCSKGVGCRGFGDAPFSGAFCVALARENVRYRCHRMRI